MFLGLSKGFGIHDPVFTRRKFRRKEFRRVAFLVLRTGGLRIKAGALESGERNQTGPDHFPCHLGFNVVLCCQTGEFGTDAPKFRGQALVVSRR